MLSLSWVAVIKKAPKSQNNTRKQSYLRFSHSEQVTISGNGAFSKQGKMRERYKIEAKNSELKRRHGYDVASSSGLIGMEMQGAMADLCSKS